MPKIFYNFLSISKIYRELNSKATFLPKYVSFSYLSSGRMIDTARQSKGLYLLDNDTSASSICRTSLLFSYFTISKQDCMFSHFRLGHPNFKYMTYLFPLFFLQLMSPLYLVICVFGANNIGSPFPHNHINQPNRSSLSIVMFGVHPSSLHPLENSGL